MRSSQGDYYVALDHVRALAAFTVFTWHFNSANGGHVTGPEFFPLSFFAEGHIGVAMFMTLSGYLFAKLLDGHRLIYFPFLWNRIIRLFPLLIIVFLLNGIVNVELDAIVGYLASLAKGFVYPSWPNGGWSIAVELHFYVILPFLLAVSSRNPKIIVLAIAASILARTGYWLHSGTVQQLAYWTIVGGIDQFVLGIFAFKLRNVIAHRHVLALLIGTVLALYVTYFDFLGGFFRIHGYPSHSPIWILHPTILGIGFSSLVAWYDSSFSMRSKGLSGVIAAIGACSYSIYLLHFFIVFDAATWINQNMVELSNFPLVLVFSGVTFACFAPVAYVSYRLIELPPLRFRTHYKLAKESTHQKSGLFTTPT